MTEIRIWNEPIKVCDLHTLELEKARLRRRCRSLENEMKHRAKHVRKNYITLSFNSLFPGIQQERSPFKWLTRVVQSSWEHGHLQSILLSVLIPLFEFIGVRQGTKILTQFFAKFKKTKTDV